MSTRASAARYARALLEVAIAESNPETAERDLTQFVDLLPGHPDLQRLFANPAVSAGAKRGVVQQLVDRLRPVSPVGKLLVLLASHGRLELLPDLLVVYRERLREHQKVVQAEITTAMPLSPERSAQLQQRLATMTGRTVMMTTNVDQAIIGGVVARVGSTVYDGSVATQLARLRERLAERN